MASPLQKRLVHGFAACVTVLLLLSLALPAAAVEDCRRVQNILILFDASGYMKPGDRFDQLLAQMKLFERAVPLTKDGFFNVGLRYYGLKIGLGCQSTESILAVGPWDPERFINSFPRTVSYGTSCLSAGLRAAADDVSGLSGKTIILIIGGGLESCNLQPARIAEQIAFNNPDVEIHTFQLGGEQEGTFNLKAIAQKGRGTYARVTDGASPAQWHQWMKRYLVEPCPAPAAPAGTTAAIPNFGIVVFDNNSKSVRSKDALTDARNLRSLAAVARYLLENRTSRLVLHGFTDGKGGSKFNLRLSKKRSEAAGRYLNATFGIPFERMAIVAHGKGRPQGAQTRLGVPGRRVEFEILR